MDAVLGAKAPRLPGLLELDGQAAFQATAESCIGFEHEWAQSALGQVQRSSQAGDARADDDDFRFVLTFYHPDTKYKSRS